MLPYAPGTWYDPQFIKTGYEISFAGYFYKPKAMRNPEEICADIIALEQVTDGLLGEILG